MLLLLLAACPHPAPPADAPPPAIAPHADTAAAARDALLFGDLEGYRRGMNALLPVSAFPGVDPAALARFQVRTRAASVVGETDPPRAIGLVAVACGECHAASGATVEVVEEDPTPGDGVRAEMERHARGLRLAWAGLVAPSDAVRVQAVRAFEAGWLSPVSGGDDATVQALDAAVTNAAEQLGAAPDGETRAVRFGELVQACQACHTTRPGGLRIEPD